MPKALALYSGGLDSTLAILVIRRQGVEVSAVSFLTSIGCGVARGSSGYERLLATAGRFGIRVNLIDLSETLMEVVKNPRFGYGKRMNPCLDCKITMLRKAKKIMEAEGAGFIVTGEVLGQRPMSQRRDTFPKIDKESGLVGYVLRPLSAKLLRPTVPEEQGWVDRDNLYGFHGRSRKPQMALAQDLGLTEYPQPAGGCLLTDPVYAFRLRELLAHIPEPTEEELTLLQIGRHFRASDDCRIIVGRDEGENDALAALRAEGDILLRVEGYGSPLTVVRGRSSEEAVALAAAICARYSDARSLPLVGVSVQTAAGSYVLSVTPASQEVIEDRRIQPK